MGHVSGVQLCPHPGQDPSLSSPPAPHPAPDPAPLLPTLLPGCPGQDAGKLPQLLSGSGQPPHQLPTRPPPPQLWALRHCWMPHASPVRPSNDDLSEKDWGALGPRPQSTEVRAAAWAGRSRLGPLARGQEGRLQGRSRPPPSLRLRRAGGRVASVAAPLPSQNAGRQRRFWLFPTGGRRSHSQGPPRQLKQDQAEGQAQLVPRQERTSRLNAGKGDAGTRWGSDLPGGSQTWPRGPE